MPAAAEPSTLTLPALGTFATVLVTGPDALGPAHQVLAAELAAMDAACSRFRRDSELWRINHARGRPVTVSPLLADALAVALDAAELTDGDVDPTCGQSLVRLGYDRDFALARRHTDPLRQPPMPAGGWRRVELDRGHPAVRVPAGILLDLGATAKALAADRAAAAVQAAVGGGVLVNLGGDIRVAGDPPDGGWPVGVADDADFDTSTASVRPRQVVMVRDGGLATSSPLGRTACDDEADIIRVLDAGADDYVVKPFGPGQIEARIRAVLRRAAPGDPGAAGLLTVGGLRLDPDGHETTLDGAPLDLSRREFDLLHYLALRAGQVVTRRDLLTHVWRLPYGGADKTVDVHVSWLRRKLGETAQHPRYLHTVRGVGIKLSPPP